MQKTCLGDALWVESDFAGFGGCQHALTWPQADTLCKSMNARLCTKAELDADCTVGSGCQHDFDLIWSSTSGSTVGCADNSIEHTFSNTVVGCDGQWTSPGIANGAALCGQGWSVCASAATVAASGVTAVDCKCPSGMPSNTFYATMESSSGNWDCSTSGTNDVWGCGCGGPNPNHDCGVLPYALGGSNWNSWRGFAHGEKELTQFYKTSGNGGVMCCKAGGDSPCSSTTMPFFASKQEMETAGWIFSSLFQPLYAFKPATHCDGTPRVYCGFSHVPNFGEISLQLSGSGSATVDYGNIAGNGQPVTLYLNDDVLSTATSSSKTTEFSFQDGDTLKLSEVSAVMVINSISFNVCTDEGGSATDGFYLQTAQKASTDDLNGAKAANGASCQNCGGYTQCSSGVAPNAGCHAWCLTFTDCIGFYLYETGTNQGRCCPVRERPIFGSTSTDVNYYELTTSATMFIKISSGRCADHRSSNQ